jgi:hypothetical protein
MRIHRTLALFAVLPLLTSPAFAQTGNGAPSGAHYNLNIIGMAAEDTEDCKSAEMTGSNRHTIFVDLEFTDATPKQPEPLTSLNKRNKIYLYEGPFKVLDGNACDGDEAEFQLPAQDCGTLTLTDVADCTYDVFIRGLGSPQGDPSAVVTTCGIDDADTPGDTSDDTYVGDGQSIERQELLPECHQGADDAVRRHPRRRELRRRVRRAHHAVRRRVLSVFLGLRQQGASARAAALLCE